MPLLILLFLLYRGWHNRAAKRIGDARLVAQLMNGYSKGRSALKFFLLFTAFALGIIALANPGKEGEGEPDVRNGIDLVLAVDVSKSMLATDVLPSRLEAAKSLLKSLLQQRPNDRIGLVLFAGHAYAQLPLTYDHSNAEMLIDAIDPSLFTAQGTAVGDALRTSQEILSVGSGRYKVVLLLSDGETFDQAAKGGNAEQWSQTLADAGIQVNTVGFGSPAGATIIDPLTKAPKKNKEGATVVSKLDETLLKNIAAKTAGKYILFQERKNAEAAILQQLSVVKSVALADKSLFSHQSLYMWPAGAMFLLLLAELFIPNRKRSRA